MGRVIAIILLLGSINLSAQQALNFRVVDTTTYQQYLRGDWKELIQSGTEALDNEINYYYLQIRIAYAHFMRQEYRTAIKYYKNALEFNSRDHVAHEYLYYCYLYSGRSNDALLHTKYLTTAQKKAMNIADSSSIVSVGISHSYASTDAVSIQEAIVNDLSVFENGIQKTTNSFHMPKLYVSHRLGKHVVLNHSLSYLQKNEFSYAINSGFFLSPEQTLTQTEYGFTAEITPAEGWLIQPGFNYLNMKVPLFAFNDYGPGMGRDRPVFNYVSLNNRVLSLLVRKEFRIFNVGLSYVNNNFNTIQTHQLGLHSSIYPLANLNLYTSADLYAQQLSFGGESDRNFIYHHLLGFKILNNLWMELSATITEQINYYDIINDISYNGIEKFKSAYQANIIVPVYKAGLKIFGSFGYTTNYSYFFPDEDLLHPINQHYYNNFIITGGVIWTK